MGDLRKAFASPTLPFVIASSGMYGRGMGRRPPTDGTPTTGGTPTPTDGTPTGVPGGVAVESWVGGASGEP